MLSRLFVALAVLAATLSLGRAADHQTLTVLRECPAKGWHRACIPMAFLLNANDAGRLHFRTVMGGDGEPDKWLDYLEIEGRLLESKGGGGVRAYRLNVSDVEVEQSLQTIPQEALGAFAFIGRSRAGRPIVLTDQGPLEIRTKSVDFYSLGDLYAVREKTKRIRALHVRAYGMPFVATKSGDVGVWDASRKICITAPTLSTTDLAIITSACKAAGVPPEGAVVGGNVELTTEFDPTVMDQIAAEEYRAVNVFRVPTTGVLLIWVDSEPCC